ncbi:MAG: TlpA family protein disulfide reductase [Bdellovibrionaceae bacterium]|nr:TlpA family protein disulfide reductase [Pseudobdellovibrionaceae bacterium]
MHPTRSSAESSEGRLKHFNRIFNLALTAAAIYAVATLALRFFVPDARVGGTAPRFDVKEIHLEGQTEISGKIMTLPPEHQASVIVFWATWCGPCSLELDRIQAAINQGEIPAQQVLAVSLGENPSVVRTHITEKKYTFRIFIDESEESARTYSISGTPTTVHIDPSGKIQWAAAGLHPLSVRKARELLSQR